MYGILLGLYNNDNLIGYFNSKKTIDSYIKLKKQLNEDTTNYKIRKKEVKI